MSEALTLPGIDVGVWTVRHRFDQAAAALADRHYSREKKSPQVGGPGHILVLVTPCERAAWISKRHSEYTTSARVLADGFPLGTYRCSLFRNEGAGLSSFLIREAVALTEQLWGVPIHGWLTYVDRDKVASTNPGYCFKRAGWIAVGSRGSKVALVYPAPAEDGGSHRKETEQSAANQRF